MTESARSLGLGVVVLVVLTIGRGARADRPEVSRAVIVVVAGGGDDLEAVVRERVTEAGGEPAISQVGAIDLGAALTPPATFAPALAHVWIDFSAEGHATVLLLDQRFERGLIRYASRDRGDEVAREQIGLMLDAAVRALLDGARIGLAREELLEKAGVRRAPTPPPPPKPEPAPSTPPPQTVAPSPPRWGVRLAASYGVDAFGSNAPVLHGPGLALDVARALNDGLELAARLTTQARLPVDIHATPFAFGVEYWSVRALAVAGFSPWRSRVSFEAELGAGVDVVHVVPESVSVLGGSLAAPSDAVFPVSRLGVGVAYSSLARVALWLTLEADLRSVQYTYTPAGSPVTLFSPLPVRPGVTLEIGTP